jgi:hypothetical protein
MGFETVNKGRKVIWIGGRIPSSAFKKPQKHPDRMQIGDTMENRAWQRLFSVSSVQKFSSAYCLSIQQGRQRSAVALPIALKGTQRVWQKKDKLILDFGLLVVFNGVFGGNIQH